MNFDFGRLGLCFCTGLVLLAGCGGGSSAPLNPPSSTINAPQMQVHPAYRVIYSFAGGIKDGQEPESSLAKVGGSLFGTTVYGGKSNDGSTFGINISGNRTAFYSFNGAGNGGSPQAGLINLSGTLYGTASSGGANNEGTVFKLSPSTHPTPLYSFNGSDGDTPTAALRYDTSTGVFYGTTRYGGTHNRGTIFSIAPTGNSVTVIHTFAGGKTDGETPYSGVAEPEGAGTLYGTTQVGGKYGKGTVYAVSLASGHESVIYSFGSHSGDGAFPYSGVFGSGGALYGTTYNGGTYGKGTVFKIEISSDHETVIHSFNGQDGAHPDGNVLEIKGTLYGTTAQGGSGLAGTVFKMSASSGHETVLHDFPSSKEDGKGPSSSLIRVNGMLYGTTRFGGKGTCPGPGGCGTVYSISP